MGKNKKGITICILHMPPSAGKRNIQETLQASEKMKIQIISIIFLIAQSCQTKVPNQLKLETDKYVEKIKTTNNLVQAVTEGTVEYGENSEEIGGFEYYEYFTKEKRKLYRVEYFMNTDENLIENFYYKNDELIFAESEVNLRDGKTKKTKVYLNNKKLIYELKSDFMTSKDLIDSGNRYLAEFYK